jgi:hypothetical protein
MGHSPDRWLIIQHLFDIILDHKISLKEAFPTGIETDSETSGCFSPLRILDDSTGEALLDKLGQSISNGQLPDLPSRLWASDARKLVLKFITDQSINAENCRLLLERYNRESDKSQLQTLLLLRGLLAHGVLLTVLREKRWRVDYGLHKSRSPPTLLAVPYRAKDCPALRAEFSHPEIAIILTCLSYYYGGLEPGEMDDTFAALLKLNNPSAEYERWVGNCSSIPESIHTLSGVNLDDFEQRSLVYNMLHKRKRVVDFYLSHIVFPRDAKEFPHKLSTSGWDLAEERKHSTTGFSGTNDNRFLLPISLQQDDLPENSSTNAKVLSYLLEEENNYYKHVLTEGSSRDKVDVLLELIVQQYPSIRVILDVGAQILLQNEEVSTRLLKLSVGDSAPKAVVYFDDHDELIVKTKDGCTESLLISPFAQQLDKCFVYLDDAHTRGTDLKLPIGSRAAVTLGPKLTKDRLVQGMKFILSCYTPVKMLNLFLACMRMRQLGSGHSVMYFAPTEVHNKILYISKQRNDKKSEDIEAMDVLQWVIDETCRSIRDGVPLWATQGLGYLKRQAAWNNYRAPGSDFEGDIDRLLEELKDQESQSLEELYGPDKAQGADTRPQASEDQSSLHSQIWEKCDEFGVRSLRSVRQQEEQEREVAQETEQERCVERPPHTSPAKHKINSDVVNFINTGTLNLTSGVFLNAFTIFRNTSAHSLASNYDWSKMLLATLDFMHTIETTKQLDQYLRPVHWVLVPTQGQPMVAVVISSYEANELLPDIRSSEKVQLHLYYPLVAQSLDRNAWNPAQQLSFLCLPSNTSDRGRFSHDLAVLLGLFSGQLTFRDYNSYTKMCEFLGLTRELGGEDEGVDNVSGFVSWERRQETGVLRESPFRSSPVPFLKRVLVFRRKGDDFLESHVGRMLRAQLLEEGKDF